ncbi:hypothetical protein AB9X29_003767 [Vibrio vulnificus]
MRKGKSVQRGIATVDVVIALVLVGLVLYFLQQKGAYAWETVRIQMLKFQYSEVSSSVNEWAQGRTTAGVSMTAIKDITPSWIGDGQNNSIFGGSFTVTQGSGPYTYNISSSEIPITAGVRMQAAWDNTTYDASAKTLTVNYGL